MENEIDLVFRKENEIGNVMLDEAEIIVPGQMPDVRRIAGDQIIDGDNAMTFGQKPVDEMRPQKASAAGNNRNRIFGRHRYLFSC